MLVEGNSSMQDAPAFDHENEAADTNLF